MTLQVDELQSVARAFAALVLVSSETNLYMFMFFWKLKAVDCSAYISLVFWFVLKCSSEGCLG